MKNIKEVSIVSKEWKSLILYPEQEPFWLELLDCLKICLRMQVNTTYIGQALGMALSSSALSYDFYKRNKLSSYNDFIETDFHEHIVRHIERHVDFRLQNQEALFEIKDKLSDTCESYILQMKESFDEEDIKFSEQVFLNFLVQEKCENLENFKEKILIANELALALCLFSSDEKIREGNLMAHYEFINGMVLASQGRLPLN